MVIQIERSDIGLATQIDRRVFRFGRRVYGQLIIGLVTQSRLQLIIIALQHYHFLITFLDSFLQKAKLAFSYK